MGPYLVIRLAMLGLFTTVSCPSTLSASVAASLFTHINLQRIWCKICVKSELNFLRGKLGC